MTRKRKAALARMERVIKRAKAKQAITAKPLFSTSAPGSIRRASTSGSETD
jgi:hypothetical protein